MSAIKMQATGELEIQSPEGSEGLEKGGVTLYYGTALCNVEGIMREGIKPGGTEPGTDPRLPPMPDRAYLTSWDTLHHAFNSLEANYPACTSIAVAEVKFTEEDFENLRAYEDATWIFLKERFPELDARRERDWRRSFETLGIVAHVGVIPPARIARWVIHELTESEIRALIDYRKYCSEDLPDLLVKSKNLRPSRLLKLLRPKYQFDNEVADMIWQQRWGFTRSTHEQMIESLFEEYGVEARKLSDGMNRQVPTC